jgi:hypothetical protein
MKKQAVIILGILGLIAASASTPLAASEAVVGSRTAKSGGFFICGGLALSGLTYDSTSQQYLNDSGITNKRRTGFKAGIGYEIALGPTFSLAPAVYYATGGDKLTASTGWAEQKLDGIIVPIDLKLSFHGPFITAGPYIGYLISTKFVLDDGTSQDITDINKFHYGISFGAGFELPLGTMVLIVKGGYQLGLSNLSKTESSEDTNQAKHSAITAMLGLRI